MFGIKEINPPYEFLLLKKVQHFHPDNVERRVYFLKTGI
jgi:hypothetical protein